MIKLTATISRLHSNLSYIYTFFYSSFFKTAFFSIIVISFCSSCTSTKELQYFQDFPESNLVHLSPLEIEQRTIQKNDRLLISFGAQDPEAAAIFNRYGGVPTSGTDMFTSSGAGINDIAGFIVDQNGLLEFPIIGKMKVVGLNTLQLKDSLLKSIKPYLKNPFITVKFLDFKVTVLGEVKSPGTYNLPQNKPSLFHALGASGDLSRTAKRYDVQLFRDYNGERTVTKIDLRSKDLLNNEQVFYLKNNDVIYIQPRKGGLAGENFGIIAGVMSVVISAATLLVTINK